MADSVVLNKSMDFAIRIVNLFKYLQSQKREFVISKQILRCGTSVGSNLREAKYAQSTDDFIHKNSIALKEIAETEYWLDLLYKTDYISDDQYTSIHSDCTELIKMLTAIINTAKSNK